MPEVTREILKRINRLLDANDEDAAAELLLTVDQITLRALLIHVLQERGLQSVDVLGMAYLRQRNAA